MGLLELGKALEEQLEQIADTHELLGEEYNDVEGAWFFGFKNPTVSGFLSYEQNEESLNIATVSIAVELSDANDLSEEELQELFDINGELVNASLSIQNIDPDNQKLFINRRIYIHNFKAEELRLHIDDLIYQANIFLNSATDAPLQEQ